MMMMMMMTYAAAATICDVTLCDWCAMHSCFQVDLLNLVKTSLVYGALLRQTS